MAPAMVEVADADRRLQADRVGFENGKRLRMKALDEPVDLSRDLTVVPG